MAFSRKPEQAAPVSGSGFGTADDFIGLDVSVSVRRIEQVAEPTPVGEIVPAVGGGCGDLTARAVRQNLVLRRARRRKRCRCRRQANRLKLGRPHDISMTLICLWTIE